ncbi:Flp pilus assembly protein CpaB [Clavibacter sp. Sh2141]|uniref:Flp pilus assembly protein CpaB n=1 Tax=Clavibacter sp. Sh2141 TaxID=3395374 RepID=UPI0039BC3847
MRLRLISTLIALVLAIAGSVMIAGYVRSADQRAYGEAETVDVLVVASPIPAGTPVEELAGSIGVKAVPRSVVADDAVGDLRQFAGRVTGVDLVPGEPVLAARLVDPMSLSAPGRIPAPENMQEFTVAFSPEQAVGGRIRAGDTVGIYVGPAVIGPSDDPELAGVPSTKHVFHRVLVTGVQGAASTAAAPEAAAAGAAPLPESGLLLTFATSVADAERIIHAAQQMPLWLSLETEDDTDDGSAFVTNENLVP